MARLLLSFCMIILFGCKSNKIVESNTRLIQEEDLNWCPSDSVCSFEVLPNKAVELKRDKFGKTFTVFRDSGSSVLKFEYVRNEMPGLEDSSYREVVYVELQDLETSFEVSDMALSKYNVIYERWCFCRGATGSYLVSSGSMTYNSLKDGKSIYLKFDNKQVPQVLKSVAANF